MSWILETDMLIDSSKLRSNVIGIKFSGIKSK